MSVYEYKGKTYECMDDCAFSILCSEDFDHDFAEFVIRENSELWDRFVSWAIMHSSKEIVGMYAKEVDE